MGNILPCHHLASMTARPLSVTHCARLRLVAGRRGVRAYEDVYCMAARRPSAQNSYCHETVWPDPHPTRQRVVVLTAQECGEYTCVVRGCIGHVAKGSRRNCATKEVCSCVTSDSLAGAPTWVLPWWGPTTSRWTVAPTFRMLTCQDRDILGSPDIKVGRSPGRSDQELCDLGRNRLIHGFFWDLPEQYFLASVDGRLRRPRSGWGACSAAAKSRRKVFNLWLLLDDRWAGDTAQVEPVR